MTKIVFQIYLAGSSSYNRQFLQLFEEACKLQLKEGAYEIQVIDILKKPDWAERHKILATPTISRLLPTPEKRIIGKLNEEQALKAVLFFTEDLSIA